LKWTSVLLSAFFPKRCLYCQRVIRPDELACEHCFSQRPLMEDPVCYRCGRTRKLCTCKGHRKAFDRVVCAMRYEDGAKDAVLSMKKEAYADHTETMALEMVSALRRRVDAAAFDAVTCIPMHKKEERRRGYNQSQMLAKAVAQELGVPFRPMLQKVFETRAQKSLPMIERSGNLLGAFDVTAPVADLRILLVDDLITTGSTLHEAAKMLILYGAQSVTALTFAGTVPSEKEETGSAPDDG